MYDTVYTIAKLKQLKEAKVLFKIKIRAVDSGIISRTPGKLGTRP